MSQGKQFPTTKDGNLRPEFLEWCNLYRRARVRAMLKHYKHLELRDVPMLEQLATIEFTAERLADANYTTNQEYTTPDDTGVENGGGSGRNTHRQPLILYLQYVKASKELRSALLMTPASRRHAVEDEDKRDAMALLAETRRALIAKAREREKSKAITADVVVVEEDDDEDEGPS